MCSVGTTNDAAHVEWLETAIRTLPSGARLLDAGAGPQRFRKFCGHLQYVSQDFAQYDPQQIGTGLQKESFDYGRLDIVSDITNIPEPDGSFDAILCSQVLEHIPDPIAAMREFGRLLKPGGMLILTAPFASLTHFAPYHFATGFNRYFYETHLPMHGLDIVEMTPNGNYFEYLAQEVRRLPSVAFRYANAGTGRLQHLLIRTLLRWLDRLSKADRGSSELLAFGYHVRAVKR